MPAVAPVPFAPFWGHDDDADPLAGGALYAFAAGTDTPLDTYADPQGLTLNPHPVVLDDAGYAHIYLHAGVAYKLRLTDSQGVEQWEIDQVYGGGSGSGTAGVGWGLNTVVVRPLAGTAQAVAAVFPRDVLALGLTVWVSESVGTSQGLAQIALGTAALPDCWGVLETMTAGTETTAGVFLAYGGQPQPVPSQITLTAYGGLFDGTGALYVTGHFLTFSPAHAEGMAYTPGTPGAQEPVPPQPLASETQAGLVELIDSAEVLQDTDLSRAVTIGRLVARTALETRSGLARYGTPAETVDGTLTTVATHPAGVKAALDARVPTGTPQAVARYASGGLSLETSPLSVDATSNLRLGTAVPGTSAQRVTVLTSGVAPSAAHPADAVQLWVADLDGVAGQAALHIRDETGVLTRIGNGILGRMQGFQLTVYGVGNPYAVPQEAAGRLLVGNNSTETTYIQLPTPVFGLTYTVINFHPSPRGTRLVAAAGHTIRIVGSVSTAGGYAQSQVAGAFLTLVGTSGTSWTACNVSLATDWTVG